jgi:lysine 2,3-aminomutase
MRERKIGSHGTARHGRVPLWKALLARSVTSTDALGGHTDTAPDVLARVAGRYPVRINPYFLKLIQEPGDPIYRQCMPDPMEIVDLRGLEDPLNEEETSPVPGLTHRYPDRVLLLVSGHCPVYCRFCNRKRKVGHPSVVTPESIRQGIAYIRRHREVRDVLLSGGDPLLLEDPELLDILKALRAVPHVEVLRIGTRVPCTLPQRVTPGLARMLGKFHPLYVFTHFNHPREFTPAAARACGRLVDAGIPLGCQTVLLKEVNDDPEVMRTLMRRLVVNRVRPYYLFQPDLARGTAHFWIPLGRSLEIQEVLQRELPAAYLPHFVIDLPGGGGKVALSPDALADQAFRRDVLDGARSMPIEGNADASSTVKGYLS